MNRVRRLAAAALRDPSRAISILFGQLRIARAARLGYPAYVRRALGARADTHVFANGIKVPIDPRAAVNWSILYAYPIVVVAAGNRGAALAPWLRSMQSTLRVRFVLSPEQTEALGEVESEQIHTAEFARDFAGLQLIDVKDWVHRNLRHTDVVLLDLNEPLVSAQKLLRLQHAAYTYDDNREIGFVAPALRVRGQVTAGFDWERGSSEFSPMTDTNPSYDQVSVPRYNLTTVAHCLYITASSIDRVPLSRRECAGLSLDDQVSLFARHGWRQNVRTLTFAQVVVDVREVTVPTFTPAHRDWLLGRDVTTVRGERRVIYVLNATSVSGGIRAVFEQAELLQERGFAVEVWSLEGQPTWTPLSIPVQTFRSYMDLLMALRNEDAIKVATWWETSQIVWLGSVNTGIPVNFVQEFETWFYPDSPEGRAAVVSCYRREFVSIAIADYQRDELEEIGVRAAVIPDGYDDAFYHQLDDVVRRPDTVLAIGRRFFQKNFAMTLAAWQSLGESRPLLSLFGQEPDIVDDPRSTYHAGPSHTEVNRLYNEATCFVQTSRHEGLCLPILEAMAAGCPVITTDSHGNRYCVDGVNCIVVEQDDVAGLAAAIRRLLGDAELQDKLRAGGLATAAEFRWSAVADRFAGALSAAE